MSEHIEKWDFYEYSLSHEGSTNPFMDVTLGARFTHQDRQVQVHGFYDGDGVFKVRFMPDQEGRWRFVTHSNVPALNGQKGEFLCVAPSANNHGPVRVFNTVNFAYEDGTPYIPVGTTCYVWHLQGDELEAQTLKTLDQTPFNKMRMCVFPKRYLFNSNEPPSYPFPEAVAKSREPDRLNNGRNIESPKCWDFSRFNPEYFQHLEKRILDLRAGL